MTVSRRLRFEILRRDGHTCRYCGAKAPDVTLTVDHVIPVTLGGGDEPNNLVTACQPCNAGKSSIPADAALVEEVDATALLFAKALERAAAIRRQDVALFEIATEYFYDEWVSAFGDDGDMPDDWVNTVERFVSLGFTGAEFGRFIGVTARKFPRGGWGAWKYFCGCCWNELSQRQEVARRLIEDGMV